MRLPTSASPPSYRLPWAELLRRTFLADVLTCPRCTGRMSILAFITDLAVVTKILQHLRLPTALPEPLPARLPPQQELELGEQNLGDDEAGADPPPGSGRPRPRGPP